MNVTIEVHRGDEQIGSAETSQLTFFIGKDADSLVPVKGWRIGRQQASFERNETGVFVRDAGGLMPLKVNGSSINEFGPLTANDLIELGDYTIRVHPANGAGMRSAADLDAAFRTPVVSHEIPLSDLAAPGGGPTSQHHPVGDTVVRHDEGVAENLPARSPIDSEEGVLARALLHKRLIEAMDLRRVNVSRMDDDELRGNVGRLIDDLLAGDPAFEPVAAYHGALREVVLNEVVGLGPLEDLLADDLVSEIMVNRHNQIFIERGGKLGEAPITFSNDAAVIAAIERIVAPLGRRIDESSPMVDARLKDGSRVNAVIPPLAIKGPSITIRKFAKKKLGPDDLIRFGSVNREIVDFLQVAVERRANVVISGGTGSGKTTLLNVLSNFIPDDERIVTVEDAAELQLSQPNLVSLEARPANIEGKGAVTIRDLVKNCLRMRPDRIVVGECRGGEALDMLQAMNTGHDGSLTTAHANSPRDCMSRLEVMTLMSGLDIPIQAIREQICSAVNLIVQQTRFSCGTRRVTYVTEVTGMENGIIQMQDIFLFQQEGYGPDGKVRGKFVPTGHIPDFYQDLIRRGIAVDVSIFSRDDFAHGAGERMRA